jgi:hypothetical protein
MNGMNWPLGPRLPSSLKAKKFLASSRKYLFQPARILSVNQNVSTHHEKVTDLVGLHVKEVTAHTKSVMTLIALLGSRAVRVRETTRDPTVSAATQDVTLVTDQPELLGLRGSAATQDVTLATDQLALLGLTVSAATQDVTLATDQLALLGLTVSAATQDVTLATDQLALLGLTVSAATQDVTLATDQLGLLGQRGSAAIREEIHQIAQPGLHVSTQRIRQPMILPSPIQRSVTTARVTERIDPQLTSDLHAVRTPAAQVVLQSANL